jgi:hypothetical protein
MTFQFNVVTVSIFRRYVSNLRILVHNMFTLRTQ